LCSAFFKLLEGKDSGYVNFQNSKGVTALNIASHRGQLEIVRALLEKAKADVNIPNTSGSTSLIQASHFGHTAVVQLLLQHRAIVDRPNHKGAENVVLYMITGRVLLGMRK
jgi:ankyrin repeat protein